MHGVDVRNNGRSGVAGKDSAASNASEFRQRSSFSVSSLISFSDLINNLVYNIILSRLKSEEKGACPPNSWR